MRSIAPILPSHTADDESAFKARPNEEILARRVVQRRQNLFIQFGSYVATTLVLAIHAYDAVIPWYLPLAFVLSGGAVIGFFLTLSQLRFNDRFEDHYLTFWQMAANIIVQFCFLVVAPQIGYVFFYVIFLIFSVGTIRMTTRQATIAWSMMTFGMVPAFLFNDLPVMIPANTFFERLAAMLMFTLTVGQCAIVGLFGSEMRRQLTKSSRALRTASKRIEELAEIDELTGAFNRRSIMQKLDTEIKRARRLNHPCSIALIDLDWFKRINDTFGHPAGDEVLRTFAITTFANIRAIDSFGRYGGEEFLLVLPETPPREAERILNRIRIIVSELDWSALSPGVSLSMSAGVATLLPNETADEMLARTDSALYAAKHNGRNRIVNAAQRSEPPCP